MYVSNASSDESGSCSGFFEGVASFSFRFPASTLLAATGSYYSLSPFVCVCVCFKCIYQVAFILPGQQNVFVTSTVASPLALSCEKENVSFDLPSFGIHAGFGCLSLRSVCSVLAIFSRTSHTKALAFGDSCLLRLCLRVLRVISLVLIGKARRGDQQPSSARTGV